jgi:hypothetical protein
MHRVNNTKPWSRLYFSNYISVYRRYYQCEEDVERITKKHQKLDNYEDEEHFERH